MEQRLRCLPDRVEREHRIPPSDRPDGSARAGRDAGPIGRSDRCRRWRPAVHSAHEPRAARSSARSSSAATTCSSSPTGASPRPPPVMARCCCSRARPAIGKTRLLDAIRRKARSAGFGHGDGALAPAGPRGPARLRSCDLARTMRDDAGVRDPGRATCWRPSRPSGADALGSRRLARPRRRRPDRRRPSTGRPLLDVRGPPVGRRAQPRGRRRARAPHARDRRCSSSARTGSTSCRRARSREWRARLLSQRHAEEVRLRPLTYDQTAL